MTTTTSDVTDQLWALWRTRPVRLPDHGPAAGVAAGFGHRYNVDPVLIRVAFVVATIFGGVGIGLYLAAWLTLDKAGADGTPRTERTSVRTMTWAVIVVIAILGVSLGGTGVVALAAMLGGWWLLYQRSPQPVRETPPADTFSGDGGVDLTKGTPPAWDPLGAAPFAWDLPEPGAAARPLPKPTRSGPPSRLTWVVLGLAIIAVALTAAFSVVTDSRWSLASIAAVGLAVIGLGLIVGAFLRRGYGLLIAAAPLAGFVVIASLVGPVSIDTFDVDTSGMGSRTFSPTTMAGLQSSYSTDLGNLTLDLTALTLTADRTVDVRSSLGNVDITVPAAMNIVTRCDSTLGNVDCNVDDGAGAAVSNSETPVLTLNVDNSLGNVEVHRG